MNNSYNWWRLILKVFSVYDSNQNTRYVTVLRNKLPNRTYNHSQRYSVSRYFSITLQRRIQIYTALTRSTINYKLKFTNGTDYLQADNTKNRMALPTAFIRNQPACKRVGRVIQPNRNATTHIANLSMLKCSIKVAKRQHKRVIWWKAS